MDFPYLPVRPATRQTTEDFAGYNHNLRIGDNEFYRMENLSSDLFPVLSPRKPRGLYAEDVNVQGMIAKDSLCYIDGSSLVISGFRLELGLSVMPEDCPKQLVSMGAYIIILPDKKYLNTADFSDFGSIEAEVTTQSPVRFVPCHMDGTEYTPDYVQSQQPEEPANMALWVDTSQEPHSLKQYSQSLDMWVGIETTYVKIRSAGIGKPFRQYDGVTLSGLAGGENPQLQALEGSAIVYAREEDALVVAGMLDGAEDADGPVTVSRKMPLMDFITEHDNRLWGCRYGPDGEGHVVNELYSCALGDFRNWNQFLGLSTDSYRVSLGSDGPFTGAITHGGYPLFFKENCLHKVYGQIPANFSIQTTACRGVRRGCERSLAIVGEILYYKSRHGVCAYDGSLPVEISAPLGQQQYTRAVAAAHGSKYYISMEKAEEADHDLFAYDTEKGLWHREDDLAASILCSCGDELYCATGEGKILTMLGSGEAYEETVPWMFETGILGATLPEKKTLRRLNIRMALEPGSWVHILVQYDSLGGWQDLGYFTSTDLRSFSLPVRPRRCDHLRLRVEGEGPAIIFNMTKTLAQGSDGP